jgi:hypothetical protein
LDHAFHKLPDDTHTLRTELAPTGETDVRAFLRQVTEYPIRQFELSIKYHNPSTIPEEIIKISYRPPPSPSNDSVLAVPTDGVLEFTSDREKLALLYDRARPS